MTQTIEATYRLWQQGRTPDEIARVRELARSTVLGHLEVLILKGRTVDLSRIVPAERAALIKEALSRVDENRLSSVKELLQDAATYEEIRLVTSCHSAIAAKKHYRIRVTFREARSYWEPGESLGPQTDEETP